MKMLIPHLSFPGNAEEAFEFYGKSLGGEIKRLMRWAEMPGSEKLPESDREKIMHICLELKNGILIMGADSIESTGPMLKNGNNITLVIETETKDQADEYYHNLEDGGLSVMPMHYAFWGSYFGMLTDKYSIKWMIEHNVAEE
ncbi:MAG: VOC family protein [Firmicutes bacterium]|nr:VOC family protein [Bacillota bacterium]